MRTVLLCALAFLLPAQAQSRLPMHFEENRGQTDSRVRFVARGAGYAFFITDTETVAVLQKDNARPAVLRMRLAGASRHPRVAGDALLEGKSNYLIGSDPSKWRTNVPQFGRVRLSEVYPGIDVVWYGNQNQIEYDFVVAPGRDPRQIRMRFDGAERIEIDASGDLVLHFAGGELRQRAPFVYQERGGSRHAVRARYRRLGARELAFALGPYDPALPLVIDPVLVWSTYLGGSGLDSAQAIAVDIFGNAYVTGFTTSSNFPTASPVQAAHTGGFDAFVTKIRGAGTAIVYSTYLGGSGQDLGQGIAVDGSGNAYVAGSTQSADFPTANAIQSSAGGTDDAFVTKLNTAGTAIVYSTYLGGTLSDAAFGIDVDGSGNAYVAGITGSLDFPTANAVQAANAGDFDAFATKLNAAGTAIVYSTYLGGSGDDQAAGVAVDGAGSAHLAGRTASTNFPTANALQASNAGSLDAFVTKLNAAGTALVYSTYLGGIGPEETGGVDVDGAGNAYVAGNTGSPNFPTANALQASSAGASDVFVTKLNAAGTAFVYSTYLGGSGLENGFAVAVDGSGNAHVAGRTASTDFPTANASQPANAGGIDAFAAKLNAAGSALVDSTYLGGSSHDDARAIAVDFLGSMYVAGFTTSSDFPTDTPLQASFGGIEDAFVTKLGASSADLEIEKEATGPFVAGQDGTFTITVTNRGPTAAIGVIVTDEIPAGATFVSATPTSGTCSGTTTVTCALGTIPFGGLEIIELVVRPTDRGLLSNTASVTATTPDPDSADDSSTAIVTVQQAAAADAQVPALDGKTLLLLAALLATLAMRRS